MDISASGESRECLQACQACVMLVAGLILYGAGAMRLQSRSAIVTGAAGSIGSAVALRLAAEGADICLATRRGAPELAAEIRAMGRQVIETSTDVTSKTANQEMVAQALKAFGKVDILVTVAGVVSLGPAETLAEDEWDRVMAINLKGVFLSCQAVIAPMRARRYGRIINIGSLLAKNGGNPRPWIDRSEQERAGNVAYGSAKAGVHAMSLFLAKELAADGVTVNVVAPGPIGTRMTTKLPDTVRQQIPLGRLGRPEEVADAVAYLAGEQAGWVTGEILDVNGGIWID
jgi:NAD(P)-dependent dehydrogenase (short-subunit alcohol dehydrogenase family)